MKKILALTLALCLALAAIPAAAEDDFTGTWYVVMMGLTGATVELNADGTGTLSAYSNGEEATTECTWTLEGDILTLTANDQALPLTWDGTELVLSVEAIEKFSGESMPEGMDASLFSSMIKMSREPGSVTAAEFSAYTKDGTVPEGKTKEEMDALVGELMMAVLGAMGGMEGADLSSLSSFSAAEPMVVTVVEDNFYLRAGYGDGTEGVYIAKVKNENDAPLCISEGSMILNDADGNEIGKTEWFGETGSRWLEPGEESYVSFSADLNEGAEFSTYDVTLSGTSASWGKDAAVAIGGVELVLGNDEYSNYAAVTITNTTEDLLSNFNVVAAIRDSEGKLIALATKSLYRDQVTAGSTIILWADISSLAGRYCQENNLTMAADVEAFAWKDVND